MGYCFRFTVLSANNEDADEYHFWKNGADYEVGCFDTGVSYSPCTATAILSLNQGDEIGVRAEIATSDIFGSGSRGLSHFTGALLSSGVGFMATAMSSQSDIGANTALVFDNVLTNDGDAYDNATSQFTAPKSGLYFFSFTVLSANDEDADEYHFWKNGVDYEVGCFDSGISYSPCTATAILSLNQGDEIGVRALWTSDIHGSGSRGLSHFFGYLIQQEPTPEPTPAPTTGPTPAPPTPAPPTPAPPPPPVLTCADGLSLSPVPACECPSNPDIANCDDVSAGELCEGDGECGTDNSLNNCDNGSV